MYQINTLTAPPAAQFMMCSCRRSRVVAPGS